MDGKTTGAQTEARSGAQTAGHDQETRLAAESGTSAAQAAGQADALDQVLDDIEATLDANAEDYVSSFVQKGGQ